MPRLVYRRGRAFPRAIAWFGASSFWGHVWHLAASVIATEDIDARRWMQPDDPDELTARTAATLGAEATAPTLTEALGDDLWIDFISDTGDDGSVSAAVAEMLFERYEVDDPDLEDGEGPAPSGCADRSPPLPRTLVLPRGHLLVFGGDTAYPVATEVEIHNRVVVPYGRVLRRRHDGRRRVLLGVPGNHDWFAGLDGFSRMFRARRGRIDRASQVADVEDEAVRTGPIRHFFEWAEAFRVGRFVAKRPALPLEGYEPVQSATYWALRLAPRLDMWGADRQLRAVDIDQRAYFAHATQGGPPRGLVLCLADPAYAFLEPSRDGQGILRSLDVSLREDGPLVMTGDTHHYCRQVEGPAMHVTAGGGGAFLHPARILRRGLAPPAAEFPGPRVSLALALQVPWQIVHGRSGFLVHAVLAVLYLPACGAVLLGPSPSAWATGASVVAAAVALFFLGGWRSPHALRIGGLSALAGAAMGTLPLAVDAAVVWAFARFGVTPNPFAMGAAMLGASVYGGTLCFGTFLMVLTLLGLEQHQALSALAHPGYKHFVRLRVRRDGSAVDGWVLGKVDPLRRKDRVVLVDHFTWHNPRAAKPAEQ